MKIKLFRDLSTQNDNDEEAINGVLIISEHGQMIIEPTLENLMYLCPIGKYVLKYEYSPNFKTHLWELYGTNKRSEIKFHQGTESRHSRGCILLGGDSLDNLHNTLNSRKTYEIEIINL